MTGRRKEKSRGKFDVPVLWTLSGSGRALFVAASSQIFDLGSWAKKAAAAKSEANQNEGGETRSRLSPSPPPPEVQQPRSRSPIWPTSRPPRIEKKSSFIMFNPFAVRSERAKLASCFALSLPTIKQPNNFINRLLPSSALRFLP